MRRISAVRHLVRCKSFGTSIPLLHEIPGPPPPTAVAYSPSSASKLSFNSPSIAPAAASVVPDLSSPQLFIRGLCSTSSGPSKIVLVESEDQFNSTLPKVEDESLPAIFYFTAAWCGPCRLLSPVIEELSEEYRKVTTYKVDIDQEGLGNALRKLQINAVPTLHFFNGGRKVSEMVGADLPRLKDTMKSLYK